MALTPNVIEAKVIAAVVGSGGGSVLGAFFLWLLGVLIWHAPSDAGHAADAMARVPSPVSGVVLLLLSSAGAFIAGYRAPHTPRSVPLAAPPAPAPVSALPPPAPQRELVIHGAQVTER